MNKAGLFREMRALSSLLSTRKLCHNERFNHWAMLLPFIINQIFVNLFLSHSQQGKNTYTITLLSFTNKISHCKVFKTNHSISRCWPFAWKISQSWKIAFSISWCSFALQDVPHYGRRVLPPWRWRHPHCAAELRRAGENPGLRLIDRLWGAVRWVG